MSRNVMVDIEALGTAPGSVVISVGACYFGGSSGTTGTFKVNIDVFDQLMYGLTVDYRTCMWWNNQSTDAKDAATIDPMDVLYFLDQFSKFVSKDDYVWAKGPDFDLVLINEMYRKAELPIPWSFRNTRDVRTILALAKKRFIYAPVTRLDNELQHDALGDALFQARQVEEAAKLLEVQL